MPVNVLPILVLLLLILGVIAYYLFRWRQPAAWIFVVLSVAALIVHCINAGVERKIDEQMRFRLIEIADYHTVELTTQRGDKISCGSAALVERLREHTNKLVRVVMTGTYDYGHLRAYEVHSIDGMAP